MPAEVGVKDAITIGLALIGSILGVINTITQLRSKKVKLRVTPSSTERLGQVVVSHKDRCVEGAPLCIDVVNLSSFAVTITEVGYALKGTTDRLLATRFTLRDSKPWPRRLEPHQAVSVTLDLPPTANVKKVSKVYASTESGFRAYGTSPALTQMVERAALTENHSRTIT